MSELLELISILIFIGITVIGALGSVTLKNIVYSALSLAFCFFGLTGIYFYIGADFLAAAQIVIYVGGVVVIFIFSLLVIPKINLVDVTYDFKRKILGFIAMLLINAFGVSYILKTNINTKNIVTTVNTGITKLIGESFIIKYILAFEFASVLLLAAIIGAALILRSEIREK